MYYEETHRGRSMGITEDIKNKMDFVAKYYGLEWRMVPAGVLVGNGVEFWILKLKKDRVRRLLHQNHGKSGKKVSLPCDEEELSSEIAQMYFHKQPWEEKDLKKTCCYIHNHGSKRKKIMSKQRAVLEAFA